MDFKGFHVAIKRGYLRKAFEVFLSKNNPDGSIDYVCNIELKRTPPGFDREPNLSDEQGFVLSMDLAQTLMDQLYYHGIRPTEGEGTAGSLKATQNHLSDMQKLSWEMLDIVKKGLVNENT